MLYKMGVKYQVGVVIRCARKALISGLRRDNVSSMATLAVENDDQELLDAAVELLKRFKAELNDVPGWRDMDTRHQVAVLTKLL